MSDLVLEQLRLIRADIVTVRAELATADRRLARGIEMLRQDVRMVRSAINDIARESVTAGEIEALHTDLNRAQTTIDQLTTRIEVLEDKARE